MKPKYQKIKNIAVAVSLLVLVMACNEETYIEEKQQIEPPLVSSFAPKQVYIGDEVHITGENFNFADTVRVGDSLVEIKSRVNDTLLIITIPKGIKTGLITVLNEYGEGKASAEKLTIVYKEPLLATIPSGGQINENVVIEGENLDYINKVYVDGVQATIVFQSSEELVFSVPYLVQNEATLSYTYTTGEGELTVQLDKNGFNILKSWPSISSVPSSGMINTEVTIIGENLNVVDSVYVGPYKAEIAEQAATTLSITVPNVEELEGYQSIKVYSYGGQEIVAGSDIRVLTKLELLLENFESFEGDPVTLKKTDMPNFVTGLNLLDGTEAPNGNFYAGMQLDYDASVYNNSGSTYAEYRYNGDGGLIDLSEFSDPWVHIWINTNNTTPYFVFYCDLAESVDGVSKGTHYVKWFNSADYGDGWQLFAWRMSDLLFRAKSSADPYSSDVFSIYNLKTFRLQFRTNSSETLARYEFYFDAFMIVDGKLNAATDVTTLGN